MSCEVLNIYQWRCDQCDFRLDHVIAKSPPPLPEGWAEHVVRGWRTSYLEYSCPSRVCSDRAKAKERSSGT